MTDICTCCGKKIPFLDIDYDLIKIGNEEYRLCAKCRSKINSYIDGNIPIEEVISDDTDKNVADYIRNIKKKILLLKIKEKSELKIRLQHRKMIHYMMIYTR